jgi:hypothetical protein
MSEGAVYLTVVSLSTGATLTVVLDVYLRCIRRLFSWYTRSGLEHIQKLQRRRPTTTAAPWNSLVT